ncbi:hypothetical protein HY489_06495 [Candidatus Woesearchaeota archaeon]|nr:hypothetical protein [Candidatus Woesearchaeota archaeon]
MPRVKDHVQGICYQWSSEQVNNYLTGKGIFDEELNDVSRETQLIDKIKAASRICAKAGFQSFSSSDIAMIVFKEQWGCEQTDELCCRRLRRQISYSIADHYKERRSELKKLRMPCSHLLRIETGCNRSNLHRLQGYEVNDTELVKVSDRVVYPGINISSFDWQEGICLPLPEEVDGNIARLFGYIWATGRLRKKGGAHELGLAFREKSRDLSLNYVKPLAERTFNVEFGVRDNKMDVQDNTESYSVLPREYASLEGLVLHKGSRAITSFLHKAHNFPFATGRVSTLPDIAWTTETMNHFLLGIIQVASLDRSYDGKHINTSVWAHGRAYEKKLAALLELAGHSFSGPHYGRPSGFWKIILNKSSAMYFKELGKNS